MKFGRWLTEAFSDDARHKNSASKSEQDMFVDAARNGDFRQVKRLLQKDSDLLDGQDRYGYTALMAAAQEGHLRVVKYLIKVGANETLKNYTDNTAQELARIALNLNIYPQNAENLRAVLAYLNNPERPRTICILSPEPRIP